MIISTVLHVQCHWLMFSRRRPNIELHYRTARLWRERAAHRGGRVFAVDIHTHQ